MYKKLLKYLPTFVYIFIFSLLAVAVRGYRFGTGDQVIQLPILYKLYDPSLFPSDAMFPTAMSNVTLLYPIILFITKILNTSYFTSFLAIYIVTNFLIFIAAFIFTRTITSDKKAALLSGLFYVYALPVAGSATSVVEVSLIPRFVGTSIILFCLTLFFRKKYMLTYFLSGILFLIHPLSSALLLLLIIPTQFLNNPRKNTIVIIKGIVIFLLVTGWFMPIFLKNNATVSSLFFISEEWLAVLKLRTPYAFPFLWSYRSWFYLAVLLFPTITHLLYKKFYVKNFTKKDNRSFLLLIVSFFVLITQIVFTSIVPLSIAIQLQLGRIWIIPIALSFVYSASFISKILNQIGIPSNKAKILILVVLLLRLYLKQNAPITKQEAEWVDVQVWANSHTSKSCAFLVGFKSPGFRVYSKRSIVGDHKDGALSFYSQEFANIWNKKRLYFNKSNEIENSEERISYLRQEYPFSLVVTSNSENIALKRLYQNKTYSVYKMPEIDKSCYIKI